MLNSITIHGRLTKDPELRTTSSNISCCNFTVAVDRNFARQGEEKQTDFFNVTAWRGTADIIGKYFSKGKEIVVHGSMQMRKYEANDGTMRTVWELIADGIDFCGNRESTSQSSSDDAIKTNTSSNNYADVNIAVDDEDLPF